MSTIKEMTQRVHNLYSKGVDSDDTRVSNRLIYNKFIGIRSRLIAQRLAKGSDKNDLTSWDYQPITKIPMQNYDWNSPGLNCPMKRSVNKIPKTIDDGASMHMTITSVDGTMKYNITTFDRVKYIKGGKYTSNAPYAFIYDEYLFLVNARPSVVSMYGIFRNPIDAYLMNKINRGEQITCVKYMDIDLYTPEDIIDVGIEMASEELIKMFNTMGVEDTRNNSADNPPEKSK